MFENVCHPNILLTNFVPELMLDNYIGCFDVENATLHSEDNLKPETCGGKCESPFFGVLVNL